MERVAEIAEQLGRLRDLLCLELPDRLLELLGGVQEVVLLRRHEPGGPVVLPETRGRRRATDAVDAAERRRAVGRRRARLVFL
jgi:hypothetical protein